VAPFPPLPITLSPRELQFITPLMEGLSAEEAAKKAAMARADRVSVTRTLLQALPPQLALDIAPALASAGTGRRPTDAASQSSDGRPRCRLGIFTHE
jgi:hypothetical protein